MTNKDRIGRIIVAAAAVAFAGVGSAQYPTPNWTNAPTGSAWQRVFPYPGQCAVDPANVVALGIPQCTTINAPSFLCDGNGRSNQSASPTAPCGSVPLKPPASYTKLYTGDTQRNFKYLNEVLNPLDYTPDTAKFKGADYYEIAVHESWGYQPVATAGTALGLGQNGVPGVFPDPTVAKAVPAGEVLGGTVLPAAGAVPDGSQWTGLRDPATGTPIYTPVWGIGQVNMSGGPVTATLADVGTCSLSKAVCFVSAKPTTCKGAPQGRKTDVCQPTPLFNPAKQTSTSWSRNNYVSTWPSISIRGKAGTPVVVKWINEFPNNHLFCPHPEAADWPCAIDRTFMGVKSSINPATAPPTFQNSPLPYDGVNQYGSPMQPDNSWVTHLHGGEIPPQTDGFAEKWFGNSVTGKIYSPQPWPLDPVFNAPQGTLTASRSAGPAGPQFGNIFRPGGPAGANVGGWSGYNFDTYTYPLVNRESTIWFHDHTLGKTHHNVVAGPAGFFPVIEPLHHGACPFDYAAGTCTCNAAAGTDCEYSWLDALSTPRGPLGMPKYDLFLAIQDRDFNADGTINFPNGMANVDTSGSPLSGYPAVNGTKPFAPGPNPQVHPVWVPEYFASNAVVNGVLWPKKQVEPGFLRVRFVDGSDARCYNLAFNTVDPWAGGTLNRPDPAGDLTFTVIANEQGYLPAPISATQLTMCPGERYEVILDFTTLAGKKVYVINDAAAPFPGGGNGPFTSGSPYADMATLMRFDVVAQATPSADLVTKLVIPTSLDGDFVDATKFKVCPDVSGDPLGKGCITAVRNLYLAEKIDGTTGASLGLQINGVPFEYDVTETPKKGTYEQWNIINLTVDAHPMHPHLAKFQISGRQDFDVARYKLALCATNTASAGGSYPPALGTSWADNFSALDNNCSPGMAPGGVMQVIPDIASGTPGVDKNGNATIIPFLLGFRQAADPTEAGWKDAMRAMPGQVLTIVGKWDGSWNSAATLAAVTAPGAGNTSGVVGANPALWAYPDVTTGPYVWHCHINSHEDSEMMRTSLVVK